MKKAFGSHRWLRYLPAAALTILGAVGGYLYYRFIGCVSGTCPITSDPVKSAVFGGAFGFLLGIIVTPAKKKTRQQEEREYE